MKNGPAIGTSRNTCFRIRPVMLAAWHGLLVGRAVAGERGE